MLIKFQMVQLVQYTMRVELNFILNEIKILPKGWRDSPKKENYFFSHCYEFTFQ
jgi:hypothetical protein